MRLPQGLKGQVQTERKMPVVEDPSICPVITGREKGPIFEIVIVLVIVWLLLSKS